MIKYKREKKIPAVSPDFELKPDGVQLPGKDNSVVGYAQFLNLGFYLATPLIAGVFFGLWFDKKLQSTPWGVLGGIVLGACGTFYNLIKLVSRT